MKSRVVMGMGPALAVVGAFVACNGQTLDLGEDEGDSGSRSTFPSLDATSPLDAGATRHIQDSSSDAQPDAFPPTGSGNDPDDAASSEFLGDDGSWEVQGDDEGWSGYLENATWPTGSDAVRFTFDVQPDGGVTGHAYFGTLPLFPAPTDPSVGFPYANDEHNVVQDVEMVEGFAYTLQSASLLNGRFRATVYPREMQARWCSPE
jgi:hypothetical protein